VKAIRASGNLGAVSVAIAGAFSAITLESRPPSIPGEGGGKTDAGAASANVSGIEELVRALQAIGSTPRDVLAILQAMRSAGALDAELEVI
jgi:hypothetical protein